MVDAETLGMDITLKEEDQIYTSSSSNKFQGFVTNKNGEHVSLFQFIHLAFCSPLFFLLTLDMDITLENFIVCLIIDSISLLSADFIG